MAQENHSSAYSANVATDLPINIFVTDDNLTSTHGVGPEQAVPAISRLICVVAPALNEEAALQPFFDSLRGQRTDYPFAVIVVDNGSTDETASLALRQGANVVGCPQPGVTLA